MRADMGNSITTCHRWYTSDAFLPGRPSSFWCRDECQWYEFFYCLSA